MVIVAATSSLYLWLSTFLPAGDRLLDVIVFISTFVVVSGVVSKIFGIGELLRAGEDERDEFIQLASTSKAVDVWLYEIFLAVLVVPLASWLGLLEWSPELSGFVKGLGVSALTFTAALILSWVKTYKRYS
jgi:hypothetical protein